MSRKVLVNTDFKAALNVDHTVQHIRLRDTDRADYTNHGFIIDMNAEIGRLYFYENPNFLERVRFHAPAHADPHDVIFYKGDGTTPALTWDNSADSWSVAGGLLLPGNPSAALGAAPKQYVDTFLPLAGGTLTGPLILAANPSALLGAATKQYVDGWLPVSGFDQDLTGSTISTTNTVEQSCTITIPASWATYRILASWTNNVYVSGTLGSQRTITAELRMTNVSGTLIGRSRPALGTAAQGFTSISIAVNGAIGAQTATGSVVIAACLAIAADTGQASYRDGTLNVLAHRLT